MKLSLVVAQGVHEGKVIPIPVAQFLIGRDESCQLRPASAAVSKRHCAIHTNEGKVYVRDIGSTNGTFLNNVQVTEEVEVKDGDLLKVGPLEFRIRVETTAPTPKPFGESKPGVPKPSADVPKNNKSPSEEQDAEKMAALLLGTDDGPTEPITEDKIPAGTTVFDMPTVGGQDEKDKPKEQQTGDTSDAAAAILKKYMQRPRS